MHHCFFQLLWVHFFDIVFCCSFFNGLQASRGISSFFSCNFTSNAVRIMSGDAFLARVMAIFIKACILQRLNWVTTTVEKSVKNYVEWYFQSAQRLNFSRLYAGIMIIHCIHCIHCIYCLSASKMTYVWVISVEDDLF